MAALDTIQGLYTYHALFDEILFEKAHISMKHGRFEDADSLFALILKNYPADILGDNALFSRAELYETKFRNKDKAMELYQQVLTDYPGSLYVVEARKRYRTLRGDSL
jgi:TolA-binding protein